MSSVNLKVQKYNIMAELYLRNDVMRFEREKIERMMDFGACSECVCVCEAHDLVGTILTVGMYLLAMHLSHTHSAESSVVSRLYASSLMPVHSLSREREREREREN